MCAEQKVPSKHYNEMVGRFPEFMSMVQKLGKTAHDAGPLEGKTKELVQLAAAASLQSEGAVHSHTRRAVEAGASQEEVYHALLLLVSTIGFPRVSAAVSWARDILNE
ncbi:MAG: carboxymuconolactone decarboxylase family protein [Desulfobacterales bacterium]|nr:carboxymuconolactone decarboxylase family protein [Desulfobacterales bacterium]